MIDTLTYGLQPTYAEVWVLVYERPCETGPSVRWITLASREAVADSCSEINLIARYRIPLAPGPDHWRSETATPTAQAGMTEQQWID
jgi:hypothetical protein